MSVQVYRANSQYPPLPNKYADESDGWVKLCDYTALKTRCQQAEQERNDMREGRVAACEDENILRVQYNRLRDTLVLLGEQAKSALDIYDKEIMVTMLKAVIAAAEKLPNV